MLPALVKIGRRVNGMELLYFLPPCLQQQHKAVEELRLLQEVLAAGAAGPLQPPVWAVLPGLPRPSPRRKEQRRIRSLKTSSRYSEALC